MEFLRVRVEVADGELCVRPLPNQASGAVTSFAEAEALAILPADLEVIEAGTLVDALRIADM